MWEWGARHAYWKRSTAPLRDGQHALSDGASHCSMKCISHRPDVKIIFLACTPFAVFNWSHHLSEVPMKGLEAFPHINESQSSPFIPTAGDCYKLLWFLNQQNSLVPSLPHRKGDLVLLLCLYIFSFLSPPFQLAPSTGAASFEQFQPPPFPFIWWYTLCHLWF